jgi:hypothetical protein
VAQVHVQLVNIAHQHQMNAKLHQLKQHVPQQMEQLLQQLLADVVPMLAL